VSSESGQEVHWLEFHVDEIWDFIGKMEGISLRMSVRAPQGSKPLMLLGQDEAVFSQFLLGQRQWVGPKGERGLLPKTDGESIMASAMQGRETGFGRKMSTEELETVNRTRRDKEYVDKEAAMEVNKTTRKPDLAESPFIRYLHVGIHNDGYWNSNHMAIQLEDVADCLKVLYPEYDYVILFDHSSGHDRKRDGALDATTMNYGFGGAQQETRDSKIEAVDGYVGPLQRILQVGQNQVFGFRMGDRGPFWMTPEERIATMHDHPTGAMKEDSKTKKELLQDLLDKGVNVPRGLGHGKKDLQLYATENDISLTINRAKVKQGWMNKPKGLLQVLWERGFIDEKNLKQYTTRGRKIKETGKWDTTYSLRRMMAECLDFKNEESSLQYLGRQLGIRVDHSPKFHAEIAGEGIEYAWGYGKNLYRRKPLVLKKGRDKFKALVRACLDPEKEVTRDRVRKFSARARAYMCTYYWLALKEEQRQQQAQGEDELATPVGRQQIHFHEIERLMKKFRTHRCALDFDLGFVNAVLRERESEAV
jgi:hypothetical protein